MCNNPRQGGGCAVMYRGDAIWAAVALARDVFAAHGLGDRSAYPAYTCGGGGGGGGGGASAFPRQVWPECFGLRRVPVGDGSWGDAAYEVPLAPRGWRAGQPPGNDRVLVDAAGNYLAVTTDRGEYEAGVRHYGIPVFVTGHRNPDAALPGQDFAAQYWRPVLGWLRSWNVGGHQRL